MVIVKVWVCESGYAVVCFHVRNCGWYVQQLKKGTRGISGVLRVAENCFGVEAQLIGWGSLCQFRFCANPWWPIVKRILGMRINQAFCQSKLSSASRVLSCYPLENLVGSSVFYLSLCIPFINMLISAVDLLAEIESLTVRVLALHATLIMR